MLSVVREQDHIVRFLERVRDGKFTSPLLIVGPEGTGRRTAVYNLALELFCSGTKDETCSCFDCTQLRKGVHPDYYDLRAGEKDIGVEGIRDLIETSYSSPSVAPVRIFLIDGADRLTTPAANALLKTLEEPPPQARFILLAETQEGILPTIKSRCGLLNTRTLSEGYILSKVQQFESNPTKALVLTRMGEGSVGRSLQLWGSGRLALRDKSFALLRASVAQDVAAIFSLVDSLEKELPLSLRFADQLIHDLLMTFVVPDKLINVDLTVELHTLCQKTSASAWQKLRIELRKTQLTFQRTKINLPFHVKTLLLQAFSGR